MPWSAGSTPVSDVHLRAIQKYMILAICVKDHHGARAQEQDSGESVLSTVPTSEGMSAWKRTDIVEYFRNLCLESSYESIRRLHALGNNSELKLLLKYVLRHLKPEVTFRYDEKGNVKVVRGIQQCI